MSTTYAIDGMTCGGCVASLERAFASELPQLNVKVSLDDGGRLVVDGAHETTAVQQVVEDAGFDVRADG